MPLAREDIPHGGTSFPGEDRERLKSALQSALQRVEHYAMRCQYQTRNPYARLHYAEVEAQAKLMLVQVEYARLAERGERA